MCLLARVSQATALSLQGDANKLDMLLDCRLRCKKAPYNPKNFLIAPGSVQLHDIVEFQKQEKDRLHNRKQQEPYHERDFLIFFKGKCTPVNFTWKVEAVKNRIAESTVNVGKLMRVHIVREIQGKHSHQYRSSWPSQKWGCGVMGCTTSFPGLARLQKPELGVINV